MRFRLQYVERLPPAFRSSSLVFGGAFHRAVERHYESVLAGSTVPGADGLLDHFVAAWDEGVDGQEVRFNKKESQESLVTTARRMLTAFADSPHSRPRGQVVGIEEELHGPIDDDLPDLLTRLDLIEQVGGRLVITDLKTSKSRWNEDKLLENGTQLQLYGDLAARTGLAASGQVDLRFLVVTKAVKPVVQMLTVPHDPEQLARTKRMVTDVWGGVVAGVFPARPGWPCRTCAWAAACEAT
jgi:hypothetical protein